MPLQNLNAYGNQDRILYGDMETDRYGVLSAIVTRRRVEPSDIAITQYLLPGAEPPMPVPCVRRSRTYKGGFALYTYRYEGVVNDLSFEDRIFCDLEGSDNQEPIQTHPLFAAIYKKYDGKPKGNGTFDFFPLKLKDGSPNPLAGATSYLALGAIWSRTHVMRELPAGIFDNVGTIQQPQGSQVSKPPFVAAPRNWLYLAPQSRERGNVIQLTERWMLSGRKGWNPDVYTPKGVNNL